MEQTAAPPPPPPLAVATAVTTTTTTATTVHPDSVDSSPRYRTPDSWPEDNNSLRPSNSSTPAPAVATTKLRLMCSYGGHIVPRPHDKNLCYVGGDTRIVVVDRHTNLPDLINRLTKTLLRSSSSTMPPAFTVKYQLPSEDLDSLISVTTDEDLENMIDEYERLNVSKSHRLRLFLFPTKPESVNSIGSILESNSKSEDWFLSALNGTSSGFSDTSSVNCLLGLEDDVSVPDKKDGDNKGVIGKNLRANQSAQDVQSVPDSPMLETSSSFGSASSSPSLANLPPIRVNADDQHHQIKHQEDVNFVAPPAPVVISAVPVVSKVPITENPIPNPNRVASEDERSDQGFQIAHLKQPQPYQQKPSLGFDMTSPDSVSSDGSITNPLSRRKAPVIYQDPITQTLDQNTRIQIQQPQSVQDSGYVNPTTPTQVDPQHVQLHHQPQFIHTAVPPPQYLHHHPSSAVPMAAYYQMYPSQSQSQHRAPHPALDQHNFVYYMPARPPPHGYNLDPAASAPPSNQVPPPSGLFTAPRSTQPATKTEPPPAVYRTTTATSGALPPQLVQVPSSQHPIQPQFVGYSQFHQPSQAVASGGSGGGGGNYLYEFTDPSQQSQHIYYAPQHLQPQSSAQYQTISSNLPVEAQSGSHLQTDNSLKQQVRTSQP